MSQDSATPQPRWNAELGIWEGAAAAGNIKLPDGPLWIFGYGSLAWKPAFKAEEMRRATVKGFARLFWQRSMDHRGTPAFPGAVVTLVTKADLEAQDSSLVDELKSVAVEAGDDDGYLTVHGVAARLGDGPEAKKILADLDFREKGGYSRSIQKIEFEDGTSTEALVYSGTAENPNFYPLSLDETATVIAKANGPSGANPEYLFNLEHFLRGSPKSHDPYIKHLADLVRQKLGLKPPPPNCSNFFPCANLRGCFVGSGSDGLQLPEVFDTIISMTEKSRERPQDINVTYIGLPSYDIEKYVSNRL